MLEVSKFMRKPYIASLVVFPLRLGSILHSQICTERKLGAFGPEMKSTGKSYAESQGIGTGRIDRRTGSLQDKLMKRNAYPYRIM